MTSSFSEQLLHASPKDHTVKNKKMILVCITAGSPSLVMAGKTLQPVSIGTEERPFEMAKTDTANPMTAFYPFEVFWGTD